MGTKGAMPQIDYNALTERVKDMVLNKNIHPKLYDAILASDSAKFMVKIADSLSEGEADNLFMTSMEAASEADSHTREINFND